jgi:7-cyano-7-deazaguanine synthase
MQSQSKLGVLLSGGIDSIALCYWRRPSVGFTVDYGQLAVQGEIRAAAAVCELLRIQHGIIRAPIRSLGSGDLSGIKPLSFAPVPEWWPYRNQYLVTVTAMKAVALGISELSVGSVKTDGCHSDGTSSFYQILDQLIGMQEGGLRVSAPAIHMSSVELVKHSEVPVDLVSYAHSCHTREYACGFCRGCVKHFEVFEELGYGAY